MTYRLNLLDGPRDKIIPLSNIIIAKLKSDAYKFNCTQNSNLSNSWYVHHVEIFHLKFMYLRLIAQKCKSSILRSSRIYFTMTRRFFYVDDNKDGCLIFFPLLLIYLMYLNVYIWVIVVDTLELSFLQYTSKQNTFLQYFLDILKQMLQNF